MSTFSILRLNKKGSLIVEALLTISILAVGLTFVIRSYVSSLRAAAYTADYTMAVFLLENKMHDIRLTGDINSGAVQEENFPAPFEKYSYRLQANDAAGSGEPNSLKEIVLAVMWASGLKSNSVSLTTYLYNPEE